MKVDNTQKPANIISRAEEVKKILHHVREGKAANAQDKIRGGRQPRKFEEDRAPLEHKKIDLFGATPLGIFTKSEYVEEPKEVKNETWEYLYQRDLKIAITHPPTNYFQEMIQWTDQGKLWKFPIDNEQDLETEKDVYFTEHIFLEKHLEGWCPSKGPIRHFMELVCVGLSKNSYMTVEKKKGHIEWYKNYFEDKKTLLKEVGALPVEDAKPSSKNA